MMAIDTVAPDTLSESGDWPPPGQRRAGSAEGNLN